MAIEKTSKSALGAAVAAQVYAFMLANAKAMEDDGTVETGCQVLAEAIGYGIAKALSSPQASAAFSSGGAGTAAACANIGTAFAVSCTEP